MYVNCHGILHFHWFTRREYSSLSPSGVGDNLSVHLSSAKFCGMYISVKSNDFKATVEKINSTFTYHSYTTNRDEYNYATDVTNREDADVIWTNQNEFNVIEFNLETIMNNQLTFGNIPPRPNYIRTHKFGIVYAGVNIKHEKLRTGKYNCTKSAITFLVFGVS